MTSIHYTTYHVQTIMLNTIHSLFYLILTTVLRGRFGYYAHFIDEEIEVQKEHNKNSQQVLSTYLLEVRSYSKCFKYHPYNRPIR